MRWSRVGSQRGGGGSGGGSLFEVLLQTGFTAVTAAAVHVVVNRLPDFIRLTVVFVIPVSEIASPFFIFFFEIREERSEGS